MLEHPLELGLQAVAQLGGRLEAKSLACAVDRRACVLHITGLALVVADVERPARDGGELLERGPEADPRAAADVGDLAEMDDAAMAPAGELLALLASHERVAARSMMALV